MAKPLPVPVGQDGEIVGCGIRDRNQESEWTSDFVTSVSFSPDGKILASAWDKTVKLWDVASGRELKSLSGHQDFVSSVSFSARWQNPCQCQ
jgi:WD40 repeat protein